MLVVGVFASAQMRRDYSDFPNRPANLLIEGRRKGETRVTAHSSVHMHQGHIYLSSTKPRPQTAIAGKNKSNGGAFADSRSRGGGGGGDVFRSLLYYGLRFCNDARTWTIIIIVTSVTQGYPRYRWGHQVCSGRPEVLLQKYVLQAVYHSFAHVVSSWLALAQRSVPFW